MELFQVLRDVDLAVAMNKSNHYTLTTACTTAYASCNISKTTHFEVHL
jgi:hypothetical protein